MKKIVIAGASGFIGTELITAFKAEGWHIIAVSRGASVKGADETVAWSDDPASPLGRALGESQALINLAGRSIMTRFTPQSKEEILKSRVDSTQQLGRLIAGLSRKPEVWVNASAIGIYGDRGDKVLTEASPIGEGFLPDTCMAWESAVMKENLPDVRRVMIRIGIVLGHGGGAFEQLSKVTNMYAGGALGSGQQYVSWIHLKDLVRMFVWAVNNEVSGPINGTAPNPVTNAELMSGLRDVYGKPPIPPAPAFIIKAVLPMMGIEPSLLLDGQRVIPELAMVHGFRFEFETLTFALHDLVDKPILTKM